MDLRKITYFVAIAECRSFTKAAAKLRVAQPALSRHMKLLEEEVGLPLFVRTNQTLSLTGAGTLLFGNAQQLIRGFEQLKADMKDLSRRQSESVMLGLLPSLAQLVVPQLLDGMGQTPQNADLHIREGTGKWIEELVANNELGLGLIGHRPTNRAVEYELLAEEAIAVLGQGRLLRRLLASDAQDIPIIMTQQVNQTILGPYCREAGLEMRSGVEIDALEVVKRLILGGRGCALLPVGLFHAELARGQLGALRIDEVSLSRPITLVVRAGQVQPRAGKEIAQVLREQVAARRSALQLKRGYVLGTISLATQLCRHGDTPSATRLRRQSSPPPLVRASRDPLTIR